MPEDQPEETSLIPDSVYAELAIEVVKLHRDTTLGFALALGQRVVDKLYGGDLAAWRAKGQKDGSLRRLSEEIEKLGQVISASTLQQAVATLDVEKRVGVTARPQLTYTHVRAVLGLPVDQQEALLGKAEAKDWDSTRMKKEAAALRKKLVKHPAGRKPQPVSLRTISAFQRTLDDKTAFADLEKLAKLSEKTRAQARATLEAMVARCQELLATLAG